MRRGDAISGGKQTSLFVRDLISHIVKLGRCIELPFPSAEQPMVRGQGSNAVEPMQYGVSREHRYHVTSLLSEWGIDAAVCAC